MKTKLFLLSAAFFVLLSACEKKQSVKTTEQDTSKNASAETDTLQTEETGPRKESINLFTLMPKDSSDVAFISLSDIYPVGDEKDTLALPNIEKMGKTKAQYFTFEKNYRKRFLSKTNISETDSVFIYDYGKNKYISFLVKNLKTAALLNGYSSEEDWPYHNYDFMIGFEIDKKYLNGFSDYYVDAIVYVGKENPFVRGQLAPIKWKNITAKAVPIKKLTKEGQEYLQDTKIGIAHTYAANGFEYFLQDYTDERNFTAARRLLVIDSKSKEVIIEKFYGRGEGTSVSPLNHESESGPIQWTGKLFKNKPLVVFGFQYESFGCPGISFIDKSNEDVFIQCDNRH